VFDSAVAESTPFPKGAPKSLVGGTPGWHLSSSARRYGCPPPCATATAKMHVHANFLRLFTQRQLLVATLGMCQHYRWAARSRAY